MLTRRFILGTLTAALIAPFAQAQERPVYFVADGAAIEGYDPVSYFSNGVPVPGLPEFSVVWKGAEWHFASAENRDRFERDPRAYAPQFGGYCAYAMAHGALSSTDPEVWKIVDDKLYLTHSPAIEEMWDKDQTEFIRMAETHWPDVLYEQ